MMKTLNILKKFRWLYPGIKVKRWIFLSALGIAFLLVGVVRFINETFGLIRWLDALVIILGIVLIIAGIRSMIHSFLSLFSSFSGEDLVDIVYQKRYLERGPKIVAIGGGHGLATLLMGLKNYTTNLIAIVTVADSGGSSGRLREEFDMLPPGDIRNCLVSLADSSSLMGELFQYRFEESSQLKGHNFGNLFITAMTQVTGDFKKAVEESSRVLAIRGKVLPSTLDRVSLVAEYKDGSFTEGEADIPKRKLPIKRVYLKTLVDQASRSVQPTLEAIEAIRGAQIIVIGPGSLYTSILPNLVIEDITKAIVESSAIKIYVCNVMTQFGETDGYAASQHLKVLIKHSHPKLIEYCILNNREPPQDLLAKYQQENSFPTKNDAREIRAMDYKVIETELIHATDFVRHDSQKLAKIIIDTYRREAIRKEF